MTRNRDLNSSTGGTVVAWFDSGEDAQRAIDELLNEGFPVNEIGAAFHSAASASALSSGSPVRPFIHDTPSTIGNVGSGTTISGASSDTSGVTPSGLSTGSGTGTSGASRPGPIPGSEIPSDLPTNIPSTLRSSTRAPMSDYFLDQSRVDEPRVVRSTTVPVARDLDEENQDEGPSWWDKLKHIFSGEETDVRTRRKAVADNSFGTGKGRLQTYPESDYPYSGSAFETSFTGMGIPQAYAQRLAQEIGRGGAIVTVNAGGLNAKAERILEQNHGRIRYEADTVANDETWETGPENARVQIFGHVQRVYPGNVSGSVPGSVRPDIPTRKAS
jgi:hypothetical protein